MESLLEVYFLNGGPLMWVLLLCSVILVAIVVRDLFRYRPERVLPRALLEEVARWDESTDAKELVRRLDKDGSPMAQVLSQSLSRRIERQARGEDAPDLGEIVEEATAHVADDLYEDLGPLSTIYTVAPLLGLLGTILGMMKGFSEFARGDQRDLSVLSKGIQEALVTTLWGLAISILAYVAARYFEGRVRRFEREILPPRAREILTRLASPGRPGKPATAAGAVHGESDPGVNGAEKSRETGATPEAARSESA